jgi:hypothetical protein
MEAGQGADGGGRGANGAAVRARLECSSLAKMQARASAFAGCRVIEPMRLIDQDYGRGPNGAEQNFTAPCPIPPTEFLCPPR